MMAVSLFFRWVHVLIAVVLLNGNAYECFYGHLFSTSNTGILHYDTLRIEKSVPDTVEADTSVQENVPLPLLLDLRIEVNIKARELYVFQGDERRSTYPVAVGRKEWPTKQGSWKIHKVVWNPWWYPPTNESWARLRLIKAPGDPENPLGRAQLIYDAPRSIHGTINPSSIGHAVSHGSIRVTNEVAMILARQVMEAGGVEKSEEWYHEVQWNRGKHVHVTIPNPVPIRVY